MTGPDETETDENVEQRTCREKRCQRVSAKTVLPTNVIKPLSDDTFDAMRYPVYRESPPYVSVVTGDDVIDRMNSVEVMRSYAKSIQERQEERGDLIQAPCNWCGKPTGDWCEGCERKCPGSIAYHAICASCDCYWVHCRLCRLELQVGARENASTHRITNGAWMGTTRCHWCDEQRVKLNQCTAFGIGR